MENEKEISKQGFRIPTELLKKFKIACAQQDTTQNAIVVEAIDRFVHGERHAPEERPHSPTRWHAMLTDVLDSGDREAISAVQQSLLVFHRIINPDPSSRDIKIQKARPK